LRNPAAILASVFGDNGRFRLKMLCPGMFQSMMDRAGRHGWHAPNRVDSPSRECVGCGQTIGFRPRRA
jgi:hypothetical protein